MRACVRACVRAGVHARVRACLRVSVLAYVRECVCVCVRVCVCVCVCVCLCVHVRACASCKMYSSVRASSASTSRLVRCESSSHSSIGVCGLRSLDQKTYARTTVAGNAPRACVPGTNRRTEGWQTGSWTDERLNERMGSQMPRVEIGRGTGSMPMV